jgi:hypothetical protein
MVASPHESGGIILQSIALRYQKYEFYKYEVIGAGHWQLMPIILASQEADFRRITV